MEFDFKGNEHSTNKIPDFIEYLKVVDGLSLWMYQDLIVKIDPTVD